MTTTLIGIGLLAAGAALKYGGNLSAGAAWLWSKVPALPALPSITKKDALPTAAQAFAALSLIQDFKANCTADPSYKLIAAALREVNA